MRERRALGCRFWALLDDGELCKHPLEQREAELLPFPPQPSHGGGQIAS